MWGDYMVIKKLKDGASNLKKRVRNRSIGAITAAFAFVIALVWRDAIRKTIDAFVEKLSIPKTAYVYEFVIAVLLTIVCVIGIMIFSRWEVKEEEK